MNALISIFDNVKQQYGRDFLREVINATDNDVKANRVAFCKRTSPEEYIEIFTRTCNLFIRAYAF